MKPLQPFTRVLRQSWAIGGRRLRIGIPYGAILIGLCAIALVWMGVWQYLHQEREEAEKSALLNASNLTRTFEEDIVRALKAVDQTLFYVRASYAKDPTHFDLWQWSTINPASDFLLQISIEDKNGTRLQSSLGSDLEPANVSDRDYFQFHQTSTQDELFISKPVIGRSSGKWSIPVTRRIMAPDGSFAGVVVASLDPYYLARFYNSVDIGTKGAVVLVGTDGIVRARAALTDRSFGQSLAGAPLMRLIRQGPVGAYRNVSVVDGILRLYSYRAVTGYPLIVEVGFADDEIFATYRRDRTTYLAVATLLSLLVFAMTALITKRQVRLQQMREALSENEVKYRAVVNNLSEVVFQADAAGRLTFLNPAWTAITGFAVDESLDELCTSYIDPRDRLLYETLFRAVPHENGGNHRRDLRFRGKHGTVHWLEVRARATQDRDGRTIAFSGTFNDITERKQIELDSRASRESLARAQRIAQIGNYDEDLLTGKVEWSNQLYRVFGLLPGQCHESRDTVLQLVHPEDREAFLAGTDDTLAGRPQSATDFRLIRPDGVERILHWENDVTFDGTGKAIRTSGTIQDVTERKQIELDLHKSRESLARAQRMAQIGSFDHDLTTGKVEWSEEHYRLYGLVAGQCEETFDTILALVDPGDRGAVIDLGDEISKGAPSVAADFRILRPDGVERILHWETDVTRDAAGKPIHLFGTVQDITERKQIELDLHKSRERLARAQQIAQIGSFDHDLLSGEHAWSEELYRLCGLVPGECHESVETISQLMRREEREKFLAAADEMANGRQPAVKDFHLIRPDGVECILHWESDVSFAGACKPTRVSGTVQDITERKQTEIALRKSRESLARAQSLAHIGSFDHDLVTGDHEWSDELYRLYGLMSGESSHNLETVVRLLHPDEREKFLTAVDEVMKGRLPLAEDFRLIRPDGTECILHWENVVTFDEAGTPIRIFGTVQDITERKQTEFALLKSRENLDQAQRIAHIGSFEHDYSTGRVAWSGELYRIFGLVPGECRENIDTVIALIHPEDRVKFMTDRYDSTISNPSAEMDFRLIRGDGAERILHSETNVTRNDAGKVIRVFGTFQDITERKHIELDLRRIRENLDRAQRVARIGSFDHDLITGKVQWSDELSRLYGLAVGEFPESIESVICLVHPDDRQKFLSIKEDLLNNLSPGSADFRLIRPDGMQRVLHRECILSCDGAGNAVRLFGTVQDVTERKQAEEALRAARDEADRAAGAKSDFLATMSHEIRTPMAAVTGIIEQLQETPLNTDQKNMVAMAYDSASSLRCILDDILDFSKIEAGAIAITPEPIEISHFIPALCETLAHGASQKGLVLESEIGPEVPDHVMLDPMRLRQILMNLLSNALKFTAHGKVRLTVSAVASTGRSKLNFAVSDTGIGMSDEVIARLFQPFTQADASTTRNFGGTGLGLSISRQLAELMGGSLQATSEPGIGSTFSLLVPVEISEAATAPAAVAGDYPQFDDVHALVAEDMPTNRWLIQRQLERMGFSVTAVENGEAALAALAAGSFDLLITDFHMPKMDGVALARHIREDEARDGGMHLPILGLTADVTGTSRELCVAAGMDGVTAKPTDMESLGAALLSLLQMQIEGSDPADEARDLDAVFDDTAYRESFDADDPEGKQWLTEFVDAAQDILTDLRANVAAVDRVELAASAHRLASASLVAGAMQLGKCLRGIEGLAADAKEEELLGAITVAEGAYAATRIEIMRCLAQSGELRS